MPGAVRGGWRFSYQGVDALRKRFDLSRARAQTRMQKAADDIIERVFEVTQERVPYDTGALQGTGHIVREEHPNRRAYRAVIMYGDSDHEYAIIQHENLSYRHAPGRTAKYVEDPMNEEAPRLGTDVGRYLKGLFELGGPQ